MNNFAGVVSPRGKILPLTKFSCFPVSRSKAGQTDRRIFAIILLSLGYFPYFEKIKARYTD
jgi:hypothetical protein